MQRYRYVKCSEHRAEARSIYQLEDFLAITTVVKRKYKPRIFMYNALKTKPNLWGTDFKI